MKRILLAACAAFLVLCGGPPSGARAASGVNGQAVVSGLDVVGSGVFAPAPAEAGASKGGRYRLVRAGDTVPAAPGVAFGVTFAVRGEPAGQVAMIEAGLSPPGDAPGEGTANGRPAARRWFVPAVTGETAQAVASFAYGWEAVPGRWRLTLSQAGRVLAERDFFVGGPDTAASPGGAPATAPGAPAASPGVPVASPGPGQPPAPPPGQPAGPAAPDQAAAPAAAPGSTIPQNLSPSGTGQAEAAGTGEKAARPKAPDAPAVARRTAAREDSKAASTDAPKTATKPANGAAADGKGMSYLLQAGLFSVKDNALAEAARYRAKGYPGCVLEEGGGPKRRYRVIVGRFPDRERAVAARRSFVAREGGEVVVKEVPAAEASRRLLCR